LPEAECGADLRHQVARDIVDRALAGWRLAFALLQIVRRERARDLSDHAAAVTRRAVLDPSVLSSPKLATTRAAWSNDVCQISNVW
jgi:hypothetical protein